MSKKNDPNYKKRTFWIYTIMNIIWYGLLIYIIIKIFIK